MIRHTSTAIHAQRMEPSVEYFPLAENNREFVAITVTQCAVRHSELLDGQSVLELRAAENALGQMFLSLQQARDLAAAITAAVPKPEPVALESEAA